MELRGTRGSMGGQDLRVHGLGFSVQTTGTPVHSITAVRQQDYSASVWLRRREKLEHVSSEYWSERQRRKGAEMKCWDKMRGFEKMFGVSHSVVVFNERFFVWQKWNSFILGWWNRNKRKHCLPNALRMCCHFSICKMSHSFFSSKRVTFKSPFTQVLHTDHWIIKVLWTLKFICLDNTGVCS